MSKLGIIYTVFKDVAECDRITHLLLSESLIKCANQGPAIKSSYVWNGVIETTQEIPCLIKCDQLNCGLVIARIAEEHSYEIPAIFEIKTGEVWTPYLDWIMS